MHASLEVAWASALSAANASTGQSVLYLVQVLKPASCATLDKVLVPVRKRSYTRQQHARGETEAIEQLYLHRRYSRSLQLTKVDFRSCLLDLL